MNYFIHYKKIASQNLEIDLMKKINEFPFLSKKDNPLFWMGRLISTLNPIDRTGIFNILKTDYSPIPDVDVVFNKSFDDICYSTATYYWEKHDNITLLWSGGFDSTCVAISFIETKLKDKKLTLLGTQESVEEYPSFYEAHKHLIKIEEHEVFWNRFASPQNETTYITGDIGDQIFGGCIDEYPNYKNDDWDSFIEWEDPFNVRFLPSTINENVVKKLQIPWTKIEKKNFLNVINKFNASSPIPIKTIQDLIWWFSFCIRYHTAANNIVNFSTAVCDVEKANIGSYICFFDNYDFQQWSIKNHHLKYLAGIETYKKPMRDFILKFNNDTEYVTTKQKEKSITKILKHNFFKTLLGINSKYYLIMNDGTIFNNSQDIPLEMMKSTLTFLD